MRKDGRYLGAALAGRTALTDPAREVLVGLVPVERSAVIRTGGILLARDAMSRSGMPCDKQGFVSSATYSPLLGHAIALGFLRGGAARHGEELVAASPISGNRVPVRVMPPVFVDPDNSRNRA